MVDILPHKFFGISRRSCVATSAADKNLAEVSRVSRYFPCGVPLLEGSKRHDARFAIDGGQWVNIPRRRDIQFVLCAAVQRLSSVSSCRRGGGHRRYSTYRHKVASFLLLIPNFFLGREPHEIRSLLVLIPISIDELAYDANPGFVGAFGFEQDAVAHAALELAHARSNYLVFLCSLPFPQGSIGRWRVRGCVFIHPFPRMIFVTQLVVRVVSRYPGRMLVRFPALRCRYLGRIQSEHLHQNPGGRRFGVR